MLVVKAKTKGSIHDDVSVCRRVDDFGISVFHRPGRSYRPKASSLNRVRDDTIRSGEQAVEQSLFEGSDFVVVKEIQHREKEKDDSENCSGNASWSPDVRLGSDGPGRTLAGN
jgi:hypothetical protein